MGAPLDAAVISILYGTGPDLPNKASRRRVSLEWRLRQESHSDGEASVADHLDGGRYRILRVPLPNGETRWALSYRMEPIGSHIALENAQRAAEEHHARTHRANLWAQYMADNDPPRR